jgi:hypothetical protein
MLYLSGQVWTRLGPKKHEKARITGGKEEIMGCA